MGNPTKDFSDTNNDTPKTILVVPIGPEHIGELMGLNPQSHTGGDFHQHKRFFESYIGTGLIAMEPRSSAHPHGRTTGYALLGKNPAFHKSLCLNHIFVHPGEDKKDEYLEHLVKGAARLCMAKGSDRMDVMVIDGGDGTAAKICETYGAQKNGTFKSSDASASVYTISNLSQKFGYGAEKNKAAEPKP